MCECEMCIIADGPEATNNNGREGSVPLDPSACSRETMK